MEKLPTSFKEEGVWFNSYARALEIAGASQPRSMEEFIALDERDADRYINALNGLGCGSELLGRARQTPGWQETFGFDLFDVDLGVTTGTMCQSFLQPAYFEGTFDAPTIRQRLVDLGYHEESASGRTYYAIREDLKQPEPHGDPTVRAASSLVNRIFAGDGILVTSPSTGPIEKVLAALAGEASSLATDPAISNLASALGDPLSAAFLTRQMALEPEGDINPTPAVRRAKPEGWSSLRQWEAVGIGYGISEGQPWWAFSLFYPDPAAAEADAQELVRRMEGYTTVLPQLLDGQPLGEVCSPLDSNHIRNGNSSVLTIRCAVQDDAMVGELWGLVKTWDLGFLVP